MERSSGVGATTHGTGCVPLPPFTCASCFWSSDFNSRFFFIAFSLRVGLRGLFAGTLPISSAVCSSDERRLTSLHARDDWQHSDDELFWRDRGRARGCGITATLQ